MSTRIENTAVILTINPADSVIEGVAIETTERDECTGDLNVIRTSLNPAAQVAVLERMGLLPPCDCDAPLR